jgi:flagellar biosynthesis/type III secretory pathway M-ring protein FliF/YscJ
MNHFDFEDEHEEETKNQSLDPARFADWIIFFGFWGVVLLFWIIGSQQ